MIGRWTDVAVVVHRLCGVAPPRRRRRLCRSGGGGILPVAASTLNQQLVLCCSVVSSQEPHGIFTKTLGLHSCSHQTAVVVVTAVAHAAAGLGFFAVEVFLVSNYVNPFCLFFVGQKSLCNKRHF